MSGLSVGIVGLPNVGKSTLFNALIQREIAKVGHHPFTTVSPNKGVIIVPDERLEALVKMIKQQQHPVLPDQSTPGVEVRPATIEFVDIAGLVKGAAQGAGLGNQFLSHIREVDLILHVLREFKNSQVSHVSGRIDPAGDATTVDLELILADFEVVSKAIEERQKKAKGDKKTAQELVILEKVKQVLKEGKPALAAELNEEEEKIIKSFSLLTLKPVIFIVNINEEHLSEKNFAPKKIPPGIIMPLCIRLDSELYQLEEEERKEYLAQYGLKTTGLEEVIKTAYKTLGLITFYTVKGEEKISAWSIEEGTTALNAAGIIHTDFSNRFVKAEVINWQDLLKAGSWQNARQKGLLQLEGRDYKIRDGDVIEFKFN